MSQSAGSPEIRALFDEFESAHARGDVDALMALFSETASVNTLKATSEIRAEFSEQIAKRTTRGLALRPGAVTTAPTGEMSVEGVIDAASGDVRIASPFTMLIDRVDGRPRIKRFEYRLAL